MQIMIPVEGGKYELLATWQLYGEVAKTAVGFFYKSGWAFVSGYWVSAMIQSFVPKSRLTPYMGKANLTSVSLATLRIRNNVVL